MHAESKRHPTYRYNEESAANKHLFTEVGVSGPRGILRSRIHFVDSQGEPMTINIQKNEVLDLAAIGFKATKTIDYEDCF